MNRFPVGRIISLVVIALALMVALLAGWRYFVLSRAADALPVNTRMGGDFVLPSTRDVPLELRQLRGKVVLLNFGFASCPDVCPTVLARLRQVIGELGPDAARAQVVFVSVDPARDTTLVEHTPIDYLDFASPVSGLGSKMGIDATSKWTGETTREWGRPITMTKAVRERVDGLMREMGL